jgi:hypothetical protein
MTVASVMHKAPMREGLVGPSEFVPKAERRA